MPIPVRMPRLDRLTTEGLILEWFKNDGERVHEGEVLCRVEAAKTTFNIESPASGIFYRKAEAKSTVEIGETIALIAQPGEAPEIEIVKAPAPQRAPIATIRNEILQKEIRAAPSVRRRAQARGVDVSKIVGTGEGGRVLLKDVISYAEKAPAREGSIAVLETIPIVGWRKTMAERMSLSRRELAQVTTIVEVDATEMVSLRTRLKALPDASDITYTAFVVKAVAEALKKYPIMNSTAEGDTLVLYENRNIGLAVAREKGGLVVPVIRDADKKTLSELAQAIRNITEKAQRNELSTDDIRDGTFTVSNPGMMGMIMDTPLVNYPQSAILGVGAIARRPAVRENEIVIRSIAFLSLSYDHRVIEGAPAISFLQEVRQLLEHPTGLL